MIQRRMEDNMNEIIAALIIACSNLVQPSYSRMTSDEVIDLKKACIKRVSDCALNLVYGDQSYKGVLNNCSSKVY